MKVLALDIATKTGYAFTTELGTHVFGTWDFSPRRFDSNGMRYLRFENQLVQLHKEFKFDHIVFEKVDFAKTTQAAQVWGGLAAIMMAYCEKIDISYEGVAVKELKRFATGKGNAKKEQMIAAAIERGWNVTDDNQADACWLLEYHKTQT